MIENRIAKTEIKENIALVEFKTYYVDEDTGEEIETVKGYTRQYDNGSVFGRQRVTDELPENIKNAIFAVWGDSVVASEEL